MEPLDRRSLDETARLLAVAFAENDAYAYLHPRARDRAAALTDFFASTLALHLPHRCTYVRRDAGAIVATLTVIPPRGVSIPLGAMLRSGLPRFARAQGLLGVRRLFHLRAELAALDDEIARRRPHWYLSMMAAHPGHQGRGHGGALARACLERLVDAEGVAECTLNTQREANLVFYRRLGFEVSAERALGRALGGAGFHTWAMVRRPRAGAPR